MELPQNILALDAAGAACSAAVWSDERVAARCFEAMSRGQSERLVPMVEEVMEQAGLDYARLDAVAVTLGPGGFTGVRIGLATARAFALALSRPIIGITSFEAVAGSVLQADCAGRTLVVVLDAKRADLYVQAFAVHDAVSSQDGSSLRYEAVTAPAALLPTELDSYLPPGPLSVVGDAAGLAVDALTETGRLIDRVETSGLADAAIVATLAARRSLELARTSSPAPLYLRAPDVTLPASRQFGARPSKSRP